PVDRLRQDHADRVEQEPETYRPQTADGERLDGWIGGKQSGNRPRGQQEDETDATQEDHVVERGGPHRTLRAIRMTCAEVLPDHRRGGVAHAEGRQEREDDDPNADRVTRARIAPEPGDAPDQTDVTRRPDQDL